MAKKMVFKKEDNLYYVATYTNTGDFSSISEKGYETAGLANISAGIPEGTPTGETVSDEVEVAPADPVAPTEEVAPVTTETTVESEVVELKEVVAELGEETVAQMEAEALPTEPVAEVTAPAVEETAPVTA